MKKEQDRLKALNSKEEAPRLGGAVRDFCDRHSARVLKIWQTVYLVTVLITVVSGSVILALVVGNASNIGESKIADKIGEIFLSMDFLVFDGATHAPGEDSDFVYVPPKSDKESESTDAPDTEKEPSNDVGVVLGGIYDFDYSKVPEGCTPIIPMDLSLFSYGSSYINNSTGYSPDVAALIEKNLKGDGSVELMAVSSGPQVLIIHTHGTEAYSKDGAIYCESDSVDVRTLDTSKNVVAVGRTVAAMLNENGISTLHCTVMHDSLQYKDSYARAEETVRRYMEEFPSIRLVIDIHRDSIIKSSGEIVRPVAELDGKAAAQLMCVVGSDWAGDTHPEWENNLSLALKLRERLNDECESICRPVFLKPNTYNQELAQYSLLVEVGAEGNSLEEAQRSAELLAKSIVSLFDEI